MNIRATIDPVKLTDLLLLWQGRLCLQDWKMVATFATGKTLGCTETCTVSGDCDSSIRSSFASIRILVPGDYPVDEKLEYDAEKILVHEMLHAKFRCVQPKSGTAKDEPFEQAIDSTAGCFVDAYRNAGSPPEGVTLNGLE